MSLEETVNAQEEAQKIWDELDAEETSKKPLKTNEPATDSTTEEQQAEEKEVFEESPAPSADESEENAPNSEQVLLDKIAGIETMLSQVTNRLRNAEGHIGGLGSQLKQQLQTAQQVASQGGEAPTAKEIKAAQADPVAMESLKRDYPEFAEAMESALNERLNALEQRLQTVQRPQVQQQPSVSADDIYRMRSELQVEVRHPGWLDRVKTPEFQGWLNRQPREVQMLAASESPQDAIRLLDLHGEASTVATKQRTQRLNSAASIPTGRSGATSRTKPIEDMTPEEYWRYLDEIDRQKRN
jgi:hypothetical protein